MKLSTKTLLATLLLAFAAPNLSFAQGDTTWAQTLEFTDITKRRGWYILPQDTGHYEKILMYYTLKCDPQTTQDNFNCGEWDYTTYTNLYNYENADQPYYIINGSAWDTINYTVNPTYTLYQSWQYNIVYDATISEMDYIIGAGAATENTTFQTANATGKAQYLYKASELTATTLGAGTIDKIKIDIASLGSDINHLMIRMKNSTLDSLSADNYENSGFTTVYDYNTAFASTGAQTINFTTPFTWDGASNVVIEFAFTNNSTGTDHVLNAETTSYTSAVYNTIDDGYLSFEQPDYVDVPASAFAPIDSFITVSFWCYGDPDVMPANSYAFEGRDSSGYRVINAHLPWSNSRVYWDAGNSGTNSYDRIDQAANTADFEGQWNHWAFTKNVATGNMDMYLNGQPWLNGTAKTRTMEGITSFKIAGRANDDGQWDGFMNDFRVFNVALDATTIQEWMYKDLDASHPNYANLAAYFNFNDMNGLTAADDQGNDGTLMGTPGWNYIEGPDHYRNLMHSYDRPNMTFVQGSYTTHLDSMMVVDSVMNPPATIVEYSHGIDLNVSGVSRTPVDTLIGWESGWMYTYNENGMAVDSTFVNYDTQLYNTFESTTFQIQNYVTPYGIGFDLGPNGFRWVYDVTDYWPVLHDTIDISAGNQQELIDLKFVFISGTPPRDVIDAEVIWNGDYGHANIVNDVQLPAVDVDLNPTATNFTVRTRSTGHGFGSGENCAEFCPKLHHLEVDGIQQFQWMNWKECADNPLGTQGGSWLYDRAGWCPGTFADTYNHDITPFVTPGSTVSLDYGMQSWSPPGNGEGNYRIAMQLFSYGPINHTLDAAIDDIISPNNWEYHQRMNPVCANAVVRIKNNGATTLTSADIVYGVTTGNMQTFNWTGSLDFLETAEVTLPMNGLQNWLGTNGNEHEFSITIQNPNGGQDEYSYNDQMTTTFVSPPVYDPTFVFWFKANGAAAETEYYIKDDQGNIVESRTSANMTNYALYRDTIVLTPGCYTLEVLDSDDDGMSFPFNSDGGGWLRFRTLTGGILIDFEPDFGRSIIHHFTVGVEVGVEEQEFNTFFNVYPNPSTDIFNIEIDGFEGNEFTLELLDAQGRLLYSETFANTQEYMLRNLNLSDYADGIYHLRINDGEQFNYKKITKH
jgi:hypothetical protein